MCKYIPVLLKDVKEGDTLITDGGFTCMEEGEEKIVKNDNGVLCIDCDSGGHAIHGQSDSSDTPLVGLKKKV